MTTLTSLVDRVRLVLNDSDKKRFSDELITVAVRQALELIDLRLSQMEIAEITVTASGRDQRLSALIRCLYLVKVVYPFSSSRIMELEPGTHFSYQMEAGIPFLHFHGDIIPQFGEVLQVHYAAPNIIEGLDAETTTTLPAVCEPALVNGAAAQACSLRAASLVESYGARPGESAQLLETSRAWMDRYNAMLDGLRVLQEFGYPPGFALDAWDARGRRRANPR